MDILDLENNEQEELLSPIVYKLNRVAFHNACYANMVAIEFFENTHLSGTNGAGKSAKLNAIQLGFLPHCSFKNSDKNYYLKSSQGNHYEDDACFDFHFPETNSFIIYEFSNSHGTFCQILFRGGFDLSFERAFIPCTLEEIYHWFWTFDENDEIGKPTRITRAELINKVKEVKGYKIIKSEKDARAMLYNGSIMDEAGIYSIANVGEGKVNNLIDIFKLSANAASINSSMIKKTIVSLIENGYIDNNKDKLNFKPVELIQGFERLEAEQKALNKKENLEPEFNLITQSFTSLIQESTRLNESFHRHLISARFLFDKFTTQLDRSEKSLSLKHDELATTRKSIEGLNNNIAGLKGERKHLSLAVANHDQLSLKYNDIMFGEDSDLAMFKGKYHEVIEYLTKNISDNNDDLQLYTTNDTKSIRNLQKAKSELSEKQGQESNLERLVSVRRSKESFMINCERIEQGNVLLAINKSFGLLLEEDISTNDVNALNAFTKLFEVNEGKVTYKGINFGIEQDVALVDADYESQLNEISSEIAKIKKEVTALEKVHAENSNSNRNQLEKERDESKAFLKIITQFIESQTKADSDRSSLAMKDNEIAHEQEQKNTLQHKLNKRIEERGQLDEINKKNSHQKKLYTDIIKKLNDLIKSEKYNYQPDSMETPAVDETITIDSVETIQSSFNAISKDKDVILNGLRRMVTEGVIIDHNTALQSASINFNGIRSGIYQELADIYNRMDVDKDQLEESRRSHADITLELSKQLEKQVAHFNSYIKRLNKKMARFELSNIDGVRLSLQIDPKITDFINAINNLDAANDDIGSIVEKGLFKRVEEFIEKMDLINKKRLALTGMQLVKGIVLEYKMDGAWTTKDGSNGTSLTSSVILLCLFIEELCGKGHQLSIPINIDETNNIDFSNMEHVHQFIKDHNLILFSASPDLPLGSDSIFTKFINFDDASIYDVDLLLSKTNRTTYHYQMGSFFDLVDEDEFKEVDYVNA
jgi:hypothetical protein